MPVWLFQHCIFKIANPEPLCDGKGKPLCILLSFDYSKNILGISKVPAVNRQPGKLRWECRPEERKVACTRRKFLKSCSCICITFFCLLGKYPWVCKVPAVNPQPGKLWWGCQSAERKVACVRRTFLKSPENFSDPESCFRSAVFILNIEVSIVLQAILKK